MKDFDLQAAKNGAPVCTRDGRKVRIICWDRKCSDHKKWYDHHIVALVMQKKGGEAIEIYTETGKRFSTGTESVLDLMMIADKDAEYLYHALDVVEKFIKELKKGLKQ